MLKQLKNWTKEECFTSPLNKQLVLRAELKNIAIFISGPPDKEGLIAPCIADTELQFLDPLQVE